MITSSLTSRPLNPPRLPAGPSARPRLARHPSTPRFGANPVSAGISKLSYRFMNLLMRIFQPIMEEWIWGIFAIDVLALWCPRIGKSLTRGSLAYQPESDPEIIGKKGTARWLHIMRKRWQGLNWVNAWEETFRELQAGPVTFMFPTIAFALARRMYGKTAVELQYGPLTQITDTFARQITKNPVQHGTASYKQAVKTLLERLIGNDTMKGTLLDESLRHRLKLSETSTYGDALRQWRTQWIEEAFSLHRPGFMEVRAKIAARDRMEALKEKFNAIIQTYNRNHQAKNRFYAYEMAPVRWLKRTEKGLIPETRLISGTELFDDLVRWKDFAMAAHIKRQHYAVEALPQVLRWVRGDMLVRKFLASTTATLATVVFLFKLVQWAQSHPRYEAERLNDESKLRETAFPKTFAIQGALQ